MILMYLLLSFFFLVKWWVEGQDYFHGTLLQHPRWVNGYSCYVHYEHLASYLVAKAIIT